MKFFLKIVSVVQCSYLQSQSWLRSICDLQPRPQEPAVISPEGLLLPVGFLILHISKRSPRFPLAHHAECCTWRLPCLLFMQLRKCGDVLPLGPKMIYSLRSSAANGCNHAMISLHLLPVSQLIRLEALINFNICHRAVRPAVKWALWIGPDKHLSWQQFKIS